MRGFCGSSSILARNLRICTITVLALTEKYGLDQPIHIQFIRYVGNLLHGDMGQSIYTNEPVAREILDRLAPTIVLALLSLIHI